MFLKQYIKQPLLQPGVTHEMLARQKGCLKGVNLAWRALLFCLPFPFLLPGMLIGWLEL